MGREVLTKLSEAFTKAGVRTLVTDDDEPLLAVWRKPTDRYASESIGFHHSRTTGGGFVWGEFWQYGAPETATPEMIVAMVQETMA